MEQLMDENCGRMTGVVMSEPVYSHRTYGESFYVFYLGVTRKSGYQDCLPVMISERVMCTVCLERGRMFTVTGQIRTYNTTADGKNHLMIMVFVKDLEEAGPNACMENLVILEGYICKNTVKRTSPSGRRICDIMLAVNRMYNKSDYIPCIAWGRNAVFGGELQVGEKIYIEGRLQSREYRKYREDGELEKKTAYEVSVTRLELCD